jgi:hypothetical protein
VRRTTRSIGRAGWVVCGAGWDVCGAGWAVCRAGWIQVDDQTPVVCRCVVRGGTHRHTQTEAGGHSYGCYLGFQVDHQVTTLDSHGNEMVSKNAAVDDAGHDDVVSVGNGKSGQVVF